MEDNPGEGSGAGGAGAGSSSQSSVGTGGEDPPPPPCEDVCSSDLRAVVDCYGQVFLACEEDQGCSADPVTPKCIDDPCKAAEESRSSLGCDFWALEIAHPSTTAGACFAAFITNAWSKPVHINVEYKGQNMPIMDHALIPKGQGPNLTYAPYEEAKGLGVGEAAILFLAGDTGSPVNPCPIPPITTEASVAGTGLGDAFHITTSRPVTATQILPYGGGKYAFTSATLLLPTNTWGTKYVGISAYPSTPLDTEAMPLMTFLAQENDTELFMLPKVDIAPGSGVEGSKANQIAKYTLKAGQFLQIAQPEELTGSPLASMKPIGVWGGSSCMYVPSNKSGCDSAQQQIPPVNTLGAEFVAVRHRDRTSEEEAPPWRLVGTADDTVLEWSPAPPEGAPEKINQGEVYEFRSPVPFIVTSKENQNKIKPPFYLGAYMTGGQDFSSIGDPERVNVVSSERYLNSYVFFADPTYPETSLVVVRTPSKFKNEAGEFPFADVKLDCMGDEPITGWQPIGEYEYTIVDLVKGDFQGVGNCSSGVRRMSSAQPFGVTVWGWGAIQGSLNASYAYPAGMSVKPISIFVYP